MSSLNLDPVKARITSNNSIEIIPLFSAGVFKSRLLKAGWEVVGKANADVNHKITFLMHPKIPNGSISIHTYPNKSKYSPSYSRIYLYTTTYRY
jgi:hypothetical protein